MFICSGVAFSNTGLKNKIDGVSDPFPLPSPSLGCLSSQGIPIKPVGKGQLVALQIQGFKNSTLSSKELDDMSLCEGLSYPLTTSEPQPWLSFLISEPGVLSAPSPRLP